MEWSWLIFQIKSKGMSLRKWWKTQIVSSSPLTFLSPSPNLSQTLLLVPEAPWFLDKHVWWLSDWHSLNETRHTQIYLELSFAFKPFPFCGVASNFSFFLKRSSSRTQESSGMGARVWSPPGTGEWTILSILFLLFSGTGVGRMHQRKETKYFPWNRAWKCAIVLRCLNPKSPWSTCVNFLECPSEASPLPSFLIYEV